MAHLKAGQVAVVFGASGAVGVGIVQVLLEKGLNVVAVSRSHEKLEEIKKRFHAYEAQLFGVEVKDGSSIADVSRVRDFVISKFGEEGLDHVISSQGGITQDKVAISETSVELLEQAFHEKVTSHHVAVHALYPLLKKSKNPSPSFTIITGVSGRLCFSPQMALMTINNAAIFGYVLALFKENEEHKDKVRVNEYRISCLIKDEPNPQPVWGWPAYPSHKAGEVLAGIINSSSRNQVIEVSTPEDFARVSNLA